MHLQNIFSGTGPRHMVKKFWLSFLVHTEMNIWKTIGDLLDGSGWTIALSESDVTSTGKADSSLKAHHLMKTRHLHQVTAVTLAKLQQDAFQKKQQMKVDEQEEFDSWKAAMITKSPTFHLWDIILNIELLVFTFIRSHRERNFALYVDSMRALAPWLFALDHVNYSRWLSIHIWDMDNLTDATKAIMKFWTFNKTQINFSSIPLDQAHEQNNALVKGSGGAVGLTENPVAFRRWMVAGPEQARLLTEFESQYLHDDVDDNLHHHEHGLASQKAFKREVNNLADTMTNMGNPFLEDGSELLILDSHECASDLISNTVRNVQQIGLEKYQKFVDDVLQTRNVSIHQPLKKSTLPIFKRPGLKVPDKGKTKIANLSGANYRYG